MHLNDNKLLIGSVLLLGSMIFIKYRKYSYKQEGISRKDKNSQSYNLKNYTTNNVSSQTVVSFNINDNFLVKETLINNENKWYDIVDELPH